MIIDHFPFYVVSSSLHLQKIYVVSETSSKPLAHPVTPPEPSIHSSLLAKSRLWHPNTNCFIEGSMRKWRPEGGGLVQQKSKDVGTYEAEDGLPSVSEDMVTSFCLLLPTCVV